MTELVPSVDLKKADGSPLKVDFFFENGLPVKPLIQPPVKFWIGNESKKYGVTIIVEDLKKNNNLKISQLSYHNTSPTSKDIWVHLEHCYFIIPKVINKVAEQMKIDGLLIEFTDINGNEI